MTLLRLCLLALLARLSTQQCGVGCLMCSSSNICTLCDVTNKYILNGNTCVQSTISNCSILSMTGTCVFCDSGYYANPTTGTCIQVATASQVNNCIVYGSTQVCTLCAQNYYVLNGQCVQVSSAISNCLYYSSVSQCLQCASGYIFSNDYSSCVASPNIANCQNYSYIVCSACKTSYYQNYNNYLNQFFSTATGIYGQLTLLSTQVNLAWTPQQECVILTQVGNCNKFSSNNDTCTECLEGFFLSGNNCLENPVSIIQFCSTYSSNTVCIICQQGYYLASATSCLPVTAIANCQTYDGSKSTTTCSQCVSGFYLSSNACVARANSLAIVNCQTLSNNEDTCAKCNESFVLTTDGRLCLAAIANCATYGSSSVQSTAHTCTNCVDSYYLGSGNTANTCVLGTISNCKTYMLNANTCLVCNNGFYLATSGTCNAHITIDNCKTYSQSVANNCILCNTGYYNFNYTAICSSATLISQCLAYSTDGKTCISCNTGYYLTAAGTCSVNPSIANCKTFKTDGTCQNCYYNYVLVSGACIVPYDFYTANCANYDFTSITTGIEDAKCNYCSANSGAYNLQPMTALCVLTSQLNSYIGTFTTVTACVKYSSAGACMECSSSSPYLAIISGTPTCQATCGTGSAIIFNNLDGRVNLCVTGTYMLPMNGEGAEVQPTFLCKHIARVNWSNDNILGNNPSSTLGTSTAVPSQSANSQPLASDYVCITPIDSTGTGTSYDQFYFSTVLLERLQHWEFGLQSLQPYRISDLNNSPTTVNPPVFAYNGFGITPIAGVSGNTATTNKVFFTDNCALYIKYSPYYVSVVTSVNPATANVYYCNMCKFQYQLKLTCTTAVSSKCTVITPSCALWSGCASTTYIGFPSYLNMILSCHVCTDNSQSVVFGQQATVYDPTTMTKTFSGFGMTATADGDITTVINCLAITTSPISNCLVYGFAQVGASSDPGSSTRFCVSCKPGFSPLDADPYFQVYSPGSQTGQTYPGGKITACNSIERCASGNTMVNGCQACTTYVSGQNPPYYTFANTFYNKCVQVTTDNCFVATSAISQQCKACKSGYFLNYDLQCETLQIPNCSQTAGQSEYQLTRTLSLFQENIRIYLGLSYYGRMNGCKMCNSGYTRVQGKTHLLCIPSTYVQQNSYVTASTYTASCSSQTWSAQDTVQCNACSTGQRRYSLQSMVATCKASAEITAPVTDCVRYNSSNRCYDCGANFLTIGTPDTCGACNVASDQNGARAIIIDNLDGRVNVCVLQANYFNMNGEANLEITVQANQKCSHIARVSVSTTDLLTGVLGTASIPPKSEYTCISSPSYSSCAGPNCSNYFYPTITLGRIRHSTLGIFSNQPFKINDLPSASDFKPKQFAFNGFGITTIAGETTLGTRQADRVYFVSNCALYIKYDANIAGFLTGSNFALIMDDVYYCNRCVIQYQMQFTCANAGGSQCTSVSISCNDYSTTCSATEYSGLPSYLNAILSCNQCSNTSFNVIFSQHTTYNPTVMDTVFVPYGIQTTDTSQTNVIKCLQMTNAAAIVTDCLVYGVITTNIDDAGVAGLSNIYCVSCKAGYTPSSLDPFFNTGTPGGKITSCTQIVNCQTGSLVANGCSACTTSVVDNNPTYYAFASDRYNQCVQVTTDMCFMATSATSQQCRVCKHGYFLSYENQCEALAFSNCSAVRSDFSVSVPTFANNIRIYNGLAFSNKMYGCETCDGGTLRVHGASASTLCVSSSFVTSFSYITATYYIANCQSYTPSTASALKCSVCLPTYIPNDTNKACALQTSFPNCSIFVTGSSSLCQTCNSGYVLINGLCNQLNIQNCKTHVTIGATKVQCQTCNSGFVLSTDGTACTVGTIANCDIYPQAQSQTCTSCISGYALLTTVSQGYFCYQIPAAANCTSLNTVSGSGMNIGQFQCMACPAPTATLAFGLSQFSLVSNYQQLAQSICLLFPLVNNCISYGSSFSITVSQLTCTGCAQNFYLNTATNQCVARTVLHNACTAYNPTADRCSTCSQALGTYLSTTTWNCVAFPSGIFKCVKYSSLGVCSQCATPYYLISNSCQLSPQIANCAIYSANNTCSKCIQGFVLTNSTYCQQAVAQNCWTYTDINTCASCDPNNSNVGLQMDSSGITNCVPKNVANCVVSTNVSPFLCTQCIAGFFPSSGVCVQVANTIANCFIYDTETTCLQCNSPYVLNVSRTQCLQIANVDQNCKFLSLISVARCSICNLKYQFESGSCVSCPNSLTTGCFGCHPKGGNTCISCSPGYYMTISGTCVSVTGQNITTIPTTPVPTGNFTQTTAVPTTTTTTADTAVWKVLSSFFFFLVWLF